MSNINCSFCEKICKNNNSLRNHERMCINNPNKQSSFFSSQEFKEMKKTFKVNNQYTKAKELNLKPFSLSEESRNKISNSVKARSKELTKSIGEKSSQTIKEKVKNNEWHVSLAKDMHYFYNGYSFHGTWEVKVAMYLDEMNINWERNYKNFDYYYENKILNYTPDFYLNDQDVYLEVKGYQTEKDIAKWKHFPSDQKLIILKKYDLEDLKIL